MVYLVLIVVDIRDELDSLTRSVGVAPPGIEAVSQVRVIIPEESLRSTKESEASLLHQTCKFIGGDIARTSCVVADPQTKILVPTSDPIDTPVLTLTTILFISIVIEEIGTLVLSIKGGLHLVGATPIGDMLFAPQLLLKGADLIDRLPAKPFKGFSR